MSDRKHSRSSFPRLVHLSSRLTEQQLGELASKLLRGPTDGPWEELVFKLGLSKSDVYKHKTDNVYDVWWPCFKALVQWQRCNYAEATVETILMACQECNIPYTVYEFLLPH